ncbi:MAG: TadE family protein [Candidatus Omnitrophota bacterium]
MNGMFSRKKTGQASAELAICGSLFLFILGVLVQYGFKFNAQQEMKMKVFRDVLKKASQGNVMSSYLSYSEVNIKDVPVPDINHPAGASNLSEMVESASAMRTYFLQSPPGPSEANMPRLHIVINDKERHEYDIAHGYEADGTTPKDGFTSSGVYPGSVTFKSSSIQGWGCYAIIREISDPRDQLPLGGGDGIFWSWIKIYTTKLHVQKDSHSLQTKETIEDILETNPSNLTVQGWEQTRYVDDGEGGTNQETYYVDNPNYGFYGEVYNLGPNMDLYQRIPNNYLFEKAEDLPVLSQGVRLHYACLAQDLGERYDINISQIHGGAEQPVSSLTVQGSAWADIDSEDKITAGGERTMRNTSAQGLSSDRVTEKSEYFKIVNSQNNAAFTTRTEMTRSDKVTRKIKLNPLKYTPPAGSDYEEIAIEAVRGIFKEGTGEGGVAPEPKVKYEWSVGQ